MTPGSQIQAVIDLLVAITQMQDRNWSADDVIRCFLRKRLYIGAKDRRTIIRRIWAILRCRAKLEWWVRYLSTSLGESGADTSYENKERIIVFAYLILVEGYNLKELTKFLSQHYGPSSLSREEKSLLDQMVAQPLEQSTMSWWVKNEIPIWLKSYLETSLNPVLEDEIQALNHTACTDLRVNTLRITRKEVRDLLATDGIDVVPTPFSPIGLRMVRRSNITTHQLFRKGLLEIQDEGSQIISILVGARSDQVVVDYCAGAGGKTLALAAFMLNRGKLIACDISEDRIKHAIVRLRRAGISNVIYHSTSGTGSIWFEHVRAKSDRVLIDAPCTATGIWRRRPDARWQLRPKVIETLIACQAQLLTEGCQLVRPGGRLVYATCSLLTIENEDQVNRFLVSTPEFRLFPVHQAWVESIGLPWPFNSDKPMLQLTPARSGTDGYFVAILEKMKKR